MAVIHLSWFGKGWKIQPFFWIEFGDLVEKIDIVDLFPFKVSALSVKNKDDFLLLNKKDIPNKIFKFNVYNILDFFVSLKNQDIKEKFLIDRDIEFWERFTRWSLSFLIRQEIIPYLLKNREGLQAKWLPVLKDSSYRDLIRFIRSLHFYKIITNDYNQSDIANIILDICYVLVDSLCRKALFEKGVRHQINYGQSIHDLWLYSLLDKNPKLQLSQHLDSYINLAIAPKDIDKFYAQIIDWQRTLAEKSALSFKLLIKLNEPTSEEDSWNLEVFLQSIDDSKILIPLYLVWNKNNKDLIFVSRDINNSKTNILALLSRASKLFPPIKRQVIYPYNKYITLTTQEAYNFLKEGSWLLREEGFDVILPNWWKENTSIYKLQTRAEIKHSSLPKGSFSLNTSVRFNCYIAFKNAPLTQKEISHLSLAQKGLVKLRGKWIEIDPDHINKILKISNNREGKISISKIIAASLGARVNIKDIPIDEIKVSGWLKDFLTELKNLKYNKTQIDIPRNLKTTLRDYQVEGFGWLYFMSKWRLGACLADDMGLGKTIQVLALIDKYLEQGINGPFLIIAPTSVIGNWQREIARFLPNLSFYIHQGVDRVKKEQLGKIVKNTSIVITSYTLLTRDFDRLRDIKWFGIIADEAQNIKNPFSKQSICSRKLKSEFKVALTGTPIENSISDLWSIMEFLNPGLLGSYESFRTQFIIPIQLEEDKKVLNKLRSLIAPFILRREKTDYSIGLNLPKKKEQTIKVYLTNEQKRLYKTIVNNIRSCLDNTQGIAKKGLILSTITKLKQICDHPVLFLKDNSKIENRSGKLEALKNILDFVLSKGESSIIFTQFASMGHILQHHLSLFFDKEVLFIHGGLPRLKRDEIVEYFQNATKPQILVLSLKASGTGLNLTKATHVFHYDRWWNPAVEKQATDRAYRIGQVKDVEVYKFICKGTIEEKIEQILNSKLELANDLISSGETWITNLSDKEIKDLIKFDG